ncbi:hypothetical protein BYT27DRAFT_7191593 [Phlegmacium glaucopus]|nr:hypothetical protein BYT27DRAFT_7191593 [Phlegmacium glaucopus]
MKRLTDKQLEEHDIASRRGAIEGFLGGGAVALAGSYWAHHYTSTYRRLPISLKALGIILVAAPCLSIQAERRGLEYDRSQWEGDSMRVIDEKALEEARRWDRLSINEKLGDWAARRQYSIIIGGWATSLGVAAAIISRNKYQTFAQKIVQARMWAQGLTIGLLIVAGALTHGQRLLRAEERQHDHSWKDLLEQQERDRRQEAIAASHHANSLTTA